jgi:hypothetical protein
MLVDTRGFDFLHICVLDRASTPKTVDVFKEHG